MSAQSARPTYKAAGRWGTDGMIAVSAVALADELVPVAEWC